jgi:all-trans-retinol dehydrogenase (NAD+)
MTQAVNAISHFWTMQAFLPEMIRNNSGHVVTIASVAAFFTAPRMVDYSASKAAALSINNGLRIELAKQNITGVKTTVVCPSQIQASDF